MTLEVNLFDTNVAAQIGDIARLQNRIFFIF